MNNYFINGYKELRNTLGKRSITDLYIENACEHTKGHLKNETILKEVFTELSLENPSKVDIDSNSINRVYWRKYHEQNTTDNDSQQCRYNLCDGHGVVPALDEVGNDYAFRCNCFLGENLIGIPRWGEMYIRQGYNLKHGSEGFKSAGNTDACKREYFFFKELFDTSKYKELKPEIKTIIREYISDTTDTTMTITDEKSLGDYLRSQVAKPF